MQWPRSIQAPAIALLPALVCVAACTGSGQEQAPADDAWPIDREAVERFVTDFIEEQHIPGVAMAIVADSEVVYSSGFGWADVEQRIPMTADTVMNIASVTKTITNAALLQLRDERGFDLTDGIHDHLPFELRHSALRDAEITFRQLLTHRSSLRDGPAYEASYACGDPQVELGPWLESYVTPEASNFSYGENFLPWPPGARYYYSNVGFGVVGHLIENISGMSLADYTRQKIFEPLGMTETGWYLSDFEPGRHATLYAWAEAGKTLDNPLYGARNGETVSEDGFVPFCGYSFPNLSDGLVRTSVRQLARFLLAHMNGGEIDGKRILAEETVAEILSPQLEDVEFAEVRFTQGLAWRLRELEGIGSVWEHSGGDPGVRTRMLYDPDRQQGFIVFANRLTRIDPIVQHLVEQARRVRSGPDFSEE